MPAMSVRGSTARFIFLESMKIALFPLTERIEEVEEYVGRSWTGAALEVGFRSPARGHFVPLGRIANAR
jgi:hypothetical protein